MIRCEATFIISGVRNWGEIISDFVVLPTFIPVHFPPCGRPIARYRTMCLGYQMPEIVFIHAIEYHGWLGVIICCLIFSGSLHPLGRLIQGSTRLLFISVVSVWPQDPATAYNNQRWMQQQMPWLTAEVSSWTYCTHSVQFVLYCRKIGWTWKGFVRLAYNEERNCML